jgi:hypothetical protein
MILPEVGKIAVLEPTGNLYLIFEYDGTAGKMVRIDEPLDIRIFGTQLSAGYHLIELPAESRKIIFDRYRAISDITKT